MIVFHFNAIWGYHKSEVPDAHCMLFTLGSLDIQAELLKLFEHFPNVVYMFFFRIQKDENIIEIDNATYI